jgi:uncharacterized protein (DUF427 family)
MRAEISMSSEPFTIEPSPKRIRAVIDGKTVADSTATLLLIEGYAPVHYFPPADVRADLLRPSGRRAEVPGRGSAVWWSIEAGDNRRADAAWSFAAPSQAAETIKDHIAFDWDKVDQWLEEDEEIFGHPRDPHHRVDIRTSGRRVEIGFAGETIASTRRGLFLFETGLPPRYYIPPEDVRTELLSISSTTSICPYKGTASYWHLRAGDGAIDDAVWAYLNPLPDCRRIEGHFCFYPEKVDRIDVERPALAAAVAREIFAGATV